MSDATETSAPLATDLAAPRTEKKRDTSTGLPRIDITDRDAVFDLAVELHNAGKRRLLQVTHAELRALAHLAMVAAPVLSRAEALREAADPGTSPELTELLRVTREMQDVQRGRKGPTNGKA